MTKLLATLLIGMLLVSPALAIDGQRFDANTLPSPRYAGFKMLDGVAATTTGVWIDARFYPSATLHVTGITTATLQVRGSNAEFRPTNSADEIQIGSDITANGFTTITGPYRWLKVKISAHTTGTITALLFGTSLGRGGGGSGGSGTPGGSDTQVQFADGGVFGGDAGFTYNKTTNKVTVGSVETTDAASESTLTNIAAPGTPAAGKTNIYVDSTSKQFCTKNDTGAVACIGAGGVLNSQANLTAVACTAAEVALFTYAVPANTLTTARSIRVLAATQAAGIDANVTYNLKFGATLAGGLTTASLGRISVDGFLLADTTTSQTLFFRGVEFTGAGTGFGGGTPTETLSGSVDLKLVRTCTNTTGTVTPKSWVVSIDR